MGLAPGDQAPDFSLKNQDGKVVKLSALKGKPVLLYFYPMDDTPGCTKEACNFRDEFEKFKAIGAVVLGVSKQDQKSHQEFKAKHHLPFDLLMDTDGDLAKAYGVGSYPGVGMLKRQSVLISGNGKILKVYKDVDPDTHAAEVLKDLRK
ncbi:MAG: peroxiredoxin [Methylotenera sp.]|nr:peroxiredoxin [Oligoflexia bacterium]